jgi:hypothetical protein
LCCVFYDRERRDELTSEWVAETSVTNTEQRKIEEVAIMLREAKDVRFANFLLNGLALNVPVVIARLGQDRVMQDRKVIDNLEGTDCLSLFTIFWLLC